MQKNFVFWMAMFLALSTIVVGAEWHHIALSRVSNFGTGQAPHPRFLRAIADDTQLRDGLELLGVTDDGKSPRLLYGRLSEPLSGDLVCSAQNFIEDHPGLFRLPAERGNVSIRCTRNDAHAGTHHLTFQLFSKDTPIRGAIVRLHLGPDRVIRLIHGSFPTLGKFPEQEVLTAGTASALAEILLKVRKRRAPVRCHREWHVNSTTCRLAWIVQVPSEEPLGDFEVELDAETGIEISRKNHLFFHSGTGSGFEHHPLVASASLVSLPDLIDATLAGKYLRVINEDGPGSENQESIHVYDPDHTHFDEVNMYACISSIRNFYSRLGFSLLEHQQIKAVVHYGRNFDNAFFSPFDNSLSFGDGSRFNDLAKEESIAYHEFAHMALNAIVRISYERESGAIHEGQADYFAASHSNDPRIGEWVGAKSGLPYLRCLENTLHYPDDLEHEVHADGRIWGGTLWDIRKALGAEVADRLIHASHYSLEEGRPRFIDAAIALFNADRDLYNGAHTPEISRILQERGISIHAYENQFITGPQIRQQLKFIKVHGRDKEP